MYFYARTFIFIIFAPHHKDTIMKKILLSLTIIAASCLLASAQGTIEENLSRFKPAKGEYSNHVKLEFQVEGREAALVIPENPAPGNPWIWRPAFLGAFPSVDEALLQKGWYLAYYDVTHLYGSPRSVRTSKSFYNAMVDAGLAEKVVVEGFSRGGYFAFAWADAYPETVAAIYADAPVCDITSWPGRESGQLWNDFLEEWGVKDEEVDSDFRGNAIQHLPRIAEAGIPVMTVCGAVDRTVPYDQNMKKVRKAYQDMGGVIEQILKPDCDHHPHSLEDPEPVVDFLTRYSPGYEDRQHIHLRGSLDNAMKAMTVDRKATVAFLGGSITEMRGWREQVEDDLRQRFPDTEFKFIEAGISSLGSTPHAFRFEEDVLAHGIPDLLFVEAAVNDDTNYFGPREQVLGMEGIIRHALNANPRMDIIMLHFIYDPFVPMLTSGETPDVILNHERVANRYHITSIDLAQEISDRIQAGELTWKQFGGTHPAWLGHKYYTAAIGKVLDMSTKPASEYSSAKHVLPEPLDAACYEGGKMLPLEAATKLKGFHIDPSWVPAQKDGKPYLRERYVNCPTLVAEDGGSLVLEFDGRAVGLYHVCGPQAGTIAWSIDGSAWKTKDTLTEWSGYVHLPWVTMLADDLRPGHHVLKLKVLKGERSGCFIHRFVVNE